MPQGRGWFIHRDSLLMIEIWEHASDVRSRPEVFGISPEAVEGLDPVHNRADLVALAVYRGWVRVRVHRREAHIEGEATPEQMDSIVDKLRSLDEIGPASHVYVGYWKTRGSQG